MAVADCSNKPLYQQAYKEVALATEYPVRADHQQRINEAVLKDRLELPSVKAYFPFPRRYKGSVALIEKSFLAMVRNV